MPSDIDKSLLDRLQALRGASEPPESSPKISIDTIERAKTPTKEDTLAARLKSLRSQDGSSPQQKPNTSYSARREDPATSAPQRDVSSSSRARFTGPGEEPQKDVDEAFQTDDQTLEDLLADLSDEEVSFAATVGAMEPDDAEVKALLENLAESIPRDEKKNEHEGEGEKEDHSDEEDDNSDGEKMGKEVDDVIQRFRDEVEMEKRLGIDEKVDEDEQEEGSSHEAGDDEGQLPSLDDLPSVPDATTTTTSSTQPHPSSDMDTLTSRLAALRTTSSTDDGNDLLPSVPTTKPSKPPTNRLTSRTNYTDADVESWCTVCLEDANVRCLGCDDDVYCARCWKEMHRGERAGYEERGHRAVEFRREGKGERRKVAIGAS